MLALLAKKGSILLTSSTSTSPRPVMLRSALARNVGCYFKMTASFKPTKRSQVTCSFLKLAMTIDKNPMSHLKNLIKNKMLKSQLLETVPSPKILN